MKRQRLAVAVPAAVAGTLGAAGVAAWITGRMVLASASVHFIPMAPITGIILLLLSAALLAVSVGRARRAAAAAGALVTLVALVKIVTCVVGGAAVPDLEPLFVRNPGAFGAVPLARISPVTAVGLAAIGAAVLLLATTGNQRRARDAAGALGTFAAVLGCPVLLGYEVRRQTVRRLPAAAHDG